MTTTTITAKITYRMDGELRNGEVIAVRKQIEGSTHLFVRREGQKGLVAMRPELVEVWATRRDDE